MVLLTSTSPIWNAYLILWRVLIILSKPGSGIIASGKLSLMSPGFLGYIQSLLHHVHISTTFLHCNILSQPIYLPVKTTTLTYSDIIICFTHLIVLHPLSSIHGFLKACDFFLKIPSVQHSTCPKAGTQTTNQTTELLINYSFCFLKIV